MHAKSPQSDLINLNTSGSSSGALAKLKRTLLALKWCISVFIDQIPFSPPAVAVLNLKAFSKPHISLGAPILNCLVYLHSLLFRQII